MVIAIDVFFLKLTSTSASQEMTSKIIATIWTWSIGHGIKFMNNSKPFVTALNQTI